MVLIFFWLKITVKRIIALFKASPIMIIWPAAIIASFIYALANRHISIILNSKAVVIIISFLVLSSLLNSFKSYNVTLELIKYSKSNFHNNYICARFFILRALLNNILLLFVNIIAYYSIIFHAAMKREYIVIIFGVTVLSIISSFSLMYFRNKYAGKKIEKTAVKRLRINPLIKCTLYDYVVPNFLLMSIFCTALFLIVIVEYAGNLHFLDEPKSQYLFFCLVTIIFSIGFSEVIESIFNINWKFQAIISHNDFKYHMKRTILFLGGIFIWLLIPFIVIGSMINITFLFKYLYCVFVMFFIAIHIGFTIGSTLIKFLTLAFIGALTVWISTLPFGFSAFLSIPVIFTFIKAKDEYREWYLA